MYRFVVRVWLPDRPGALGQVASRIGAVRGDVVGIEILERGAGRAVDELVVALPEPELVDLLVAEITQVDGVDVEHVRPLDGDAHEPELEALAAAARIVEAPVGSWTGVLARELAGLLDADWAVVAAGQPMVLLDAVGVPPDLDWLAAFVAGARHLPDGADAGPDGPGAGPDDLAWTMADLPGVADGALVAVGREHGSVHWRERRTLALLTRVAASAFAQPDAPAQPRDRSTARRQSA